MTSNYPNPGSDPAQSTEPTSAPDPYPAPFPILQPLPSPDPDPTPIPKTPDPGPDTVHRVEINKEGSLETQTAAFHKEEDVSNRIKRTNSTGSNDTNGLHRDSGLAKAATYGLLVIGVLMILFYHELGGGLLIGLVSGYHFAPEVAAYLHDLQDVFASQSQLRLVALAGLLLGLLLTTPGIVLGVIIAAAVSFMLASKTH